MSSPSCSANNSLRLKKAIAVAQNHDIMKVLPDDQRLILAIVAITLGIISLCGNIAVIVTMCRSAKGIFLNSVQGTLTRTKSTSVGNTTLDQWHVLECFGKQRMMYKFCLLSLAVADLILGLCLSVVNTTKFFLQYSNGWPFGEIMCHLVPTVQATCLLTNSMTVSCIAMDRYQAVRKGAKKRWEPSSTTCVLAVIAVWIISAGASVPMYFSYDYVDVLVYNPITCRVDSDHVYHFCTTPNNKVFRNGYLVAVFSLIFVPLFLTFVGFYAVVAKFIWRQSIFMFKKSQITSQKASQCSLSSSKKLSPTFKTPVGSNLGSRGTLLSDIGSVSPFIRRKEEEDTDVKGVSQKDAKKEHSAQIKRKIRTFRVVLILIATCFFGRIPSWIILVAVSFPGIKLYGTEWWLLQFWLNLLSLSSTAVNPFLYCFLHKTLEISELVQNWFKNMWRKYLATPKNTSGKNESKADNMENNVGMKLVSMIPRGPYMQEDKKINESACSEINHI